MAFPLERDSCFWSFERLKTKRHYHCLHQFLRTRRFTSFMILLALCAGQRRNLLSYQCVSHTRRTWLSAKRKFHGSRTQLEPESISKQESHDCESSSESLVRESIRICIIYRRKLPKLLPFQCFLFNWSENGFLWEPRVSTKTFSSYSDFNKNEKVFPKFYFRSTVSPHRDDPASESLSAVQVAQRMRAVCVRTRSENSSSASI